MRLAGITAKKLAWRATAWGDPSYGMYLMSFPIQQMIVRSCTHGVAGRTMSPYLLFAVSLPISLIAGYVSWHLVEWWFLASRRVSHHEAAI
jgi:peptidoglycan/LPS O-acetylase OafA/YrhL